MFSAILIIHLHFNIALQITERGGKGVAIFCDHGDPEDVKRLFAKIETEHGGLDILVNNAYSGIKVSKSFYINEKVIYI